MPTGLSNTNKIEIKICLKIIYKMRIVLSLQEILPLCNPKMSLDALKTRFENDDTYRKSLAKKYAR